MQNGNEVSPESEAHWTARRRRGRYVSGVWLSVAAGPKRSVTGPGLVLDRDGTIIELVNYLHRREEVHLLPGAVALVRAANDRSVPVAVSTNQSGLARELYDWQDYLSVEKEIDRQLQIDKVWIDGVAACPYHPDFTPGWNAGLAAWRKPGAGMTELLAAELGYDLAQSWAIGDNVSDVEAARAAGLAGAIHVATGHGAVFRDAAMSQASNDFAVEPANDLVEALEILFRVGCLRR